MPRAFGLLVLVAFGCGWVALADDAGKDRAGPALPQAETWMYGKITDLDKDKHTFSLTGWHVRPEMRYTVFTETRGSEVFSVGVAKPHAELTGEKHTMQFMHSADAPVFEEKASNEKSDPKQASGWQNKTIQWQDLKDGQVAVVGFNAGEAKSGNVPAKAIVVLQPHDAGK